MVDLSLDLNKSSNTYKDLLVVNNDLVLTSDATNALEQATNPILQDIIQRLSFFLGEWFLDNTQGVPWFQQILVKNPSQSLIDTILLNIIRGTPGVIQVTSYSFSLNTAFRNLAVSFACVTTTGKVNYSDIIAPVSGGTT